MPPSSRSPRPPQSPHRAPPRRRRSAADARREILDAAEARFLRSGPASLRLKDIADEVGVAHPTILHHFGSREGLLRAVIERAMQALELDLIRALAEPELDRIDVAALMERIFDTLGAHGQARMLAWLALSDDGARRQEGEAGRFLRAIAELVHARRRAALGSVGRAPAFEDTQFSVMLAGLALIGEALLGPGIRASSGLSDDPEAARRFRAWLADLLVEHLGPRSR